MMPKNIYVDILVILWIWFCLYRCILAWRKIQEIADYHKRTWWGAVRMIAEDTQSKTDTNGSFVPRMIFVVIYIAILIYFMFFNH